MTRPFTFDDLDRLTPDLLGHQRAAVFHALPAELRQQAWDALAARSEVEHVDLDDAEYFEAVEAC